MKLYLTIILFLFQFATLFAQQKDTCRTVESMNALTDSIWGLDEVQVLGRRHKKAITGTMEGRLELQMEALRTLPQFLGTADLVRTMQLMPGVQTAGEINSGIYIRGGEPGHNLLLLNGAPVYNAMHLMGFFSVFNSGHFSQSTLLKSYVGPEYGGRLGGVLSVDTKDSLVRKASVEGSIGLISSQATVSLPLTKQSSLYLSGRKTYLEPILNLVNSSNDGMSLDYKFQDYNLTYVWQPSTQDKVVVTGYFGGDKLSLEENLYQADSKVEWHNIASSARWIHQFRGGGKLEQTAFFASYRSRIAVDQNEIKIAFPSQIMDFGYKGGYCFNLPGIAWHIGADYICHLTDPQYPDIKNMFGMNSTTPVQRYKTHETGVFVNCRTDLAHWLTADIGLRYSSLFHIGQYEEKKYDAIGNEVESIVYRKGELVKYHDGLEPRVSLDCMVGANRKIILSYGLHRQYMSEVAVSGIGFPTDFWVPASKNIRPQSAHVFSAGYYSSILSDAYEYSLEGYYRQLDNQLEFDGEMLDMVNRVYNMEDHLLSGNGKTYGLELLIKKNKGKLTGWVSYTLGWSRRKFPAINNGNAFPAKHDRRHDLSVVGNYRINNKWDCSAVFVYATGNAFTMPVAFYLIGENAVNEYGPHNGARMPAYHRMDLSVNYWFKRTLDKESGLNLSLYNAYARKNPVFLGVKVDADKENKTVRFKKKARYLYTLIPSISYTFKF